MKRVIGLSILLIILVGCSKSSGKEMTIGLNGNPTTGYAWTCEIKDNDIIKMKSNEYLSESSDEQMTGVGGTYEFVYEGNSKGKTSVTCIYERSWEQLEPLYKVTYDVKVDEKLSIELTKKDGNYIENIEIPGPTFN